MIANRPDWVVSRQRAWGVPIAIFVNKDTNEILIDEKVNQRIADAFEQEGADAWFAAGAAARFLAPGPRPGKIRKDRRRSRCLVRFRLDPCLHAGRSKALSGPRGHSPHARRRPRRNPVSRRLGPASRLVPVLAARNLAARAGAPLTTRF